MAMTACYSNYGLLAAATQMSSAENANEINARFARMVGHRNDVTPMHNTRKASGTYSVQQQQQQNSMNYASISSNESSARSLSGSIPSNQQQQHPLDTQLLLPQKDFSVPLHVDCSVEYELPNQAKPPPGARVEPLLLMIHPCYFRKIESEQRRSPFINNMPNSSSSRNGTSNSSSMQTRRSGRSNNSQQINAASASYTHEHNQPQTTARSMHQNFANRQKIEQNQQQKMSQMSQQAYYPANNNPSNNAISNKRDASRKRIDLIINIVNNNNCNLTNTNANTSSNENSSFPAIDINNSDKNKNKKQLTSSLYISDIRQNWEHSQMAAIPRDFQAGPDATPILSNNDSYRDDKLNTLNGKYRQYLRSHRLHPYLMASAANAFPQLTSSVFH